MSLICGHITTACHRYAHKIGEFGVDSDVSWLQDAGKFQDLVISVSVGPCWPISTHALA